MSTRREPAIDTLFAAARRRLRLERAGSGLRRAAVGVLILLPLALLVHFYLAPLPAQSLPAVALSALAGVALLAYVRRLHEREVAEWIDRQLDGASTYATLHEYADDPQPAAQLLRSAARARAPACRERLARLSWARSPIRALLLCTIAVGLGTAVLALTEGRQAARASPAAPAGGSPDTGSSLPSAADGGTNTGAAPDAAPSTPPAPTASPMPTPRADAMPDAARRADAQPNASEAGATVQVSNDDLAASSMGEAGRAEAAGRDAGAGLDRGMDAADDVDPAQLAVELRALLQAPNADPERQRSRADLAGRYRDPDASGRVGAAPGIVAAAALPPRASDSAALAPATAAWLRAYSGPEAR